MSKPFTVAYGDKSISLEVRPSHPYPTTQLNISYDLGYELVQCPLNGVSSPQGFLHEQMIVKPAVTLPRIGCPDDPGAAPVHLALWLSPQPGTVVRLAHSIAFVGPPLPTRQR